MLPEENHDIEAGKLEFISTTQFSAADIGNTPVGSSTTSRTSSGNNSQIPRGNSKVSDFMNSKGIGWLLETEDDDDEDSQASLLEELDIDVSDILYKLRCVIYPFQVDREILRNSPDFWGPLFVVLAYSLLILWNQWHVVSWVLTVWFMGSFLAYVLTNILGGDVYYSQSLGVIGYSLLPLLFVAIIRIVAPVPHFWIINIAGIMWASFSAGSLLVTNGIFSKRVLLIYPVFLIYTYFNTLAIGV